MSLWLLPTFILKTLCRNCSKIVRLTWRCSLLEERSGRAEGPRSFSNAAKPGNRNGGRRGGGGRAIGAPGPGTQRGRHATRPLRLSSHRPGQLEAETVQDFSPVCCSQHGVLVGIMTQGYQRLVLSITGKIIMTSNLNKIFPYLELR